MFMHYKWVKIEIANRRFLATRTFFQIWKSWPRYLGNGAQVLDFTLKKSEVQHPLDFTFFTVGLHFNKKWSPTVKKVKSNTHWTSLFLPLDFTPSTLSAVKSNVFFKKITVTPQLGVTFAILAIFSQHFFHPFPTAPHIKFPRKLVLRPAGPVALDVSPSKQKLTLGTLFASSRTHNFRAVRCVENLPCDRKK